MQQSDTRQNKGRIVGGKADAGSTMTVYGFAHAKGVVLAVLLLIAATFIKGGKAKKMQHQETREVTNYDLSKFDKHIQESKQLLKNRKP